MVECGIADIVGIKMGSDDIQSWRAFARQVRSKGCHLLRRLEHFPNSVLVSGCQRSGTTVLARIISSSEGMVNHWFGKDDELDGALILSGHVEHTVQGRYCFQTTYVNECYREYYNWRPGNRMIWVLRNPFSVVYSMLHNWDRWALNELFEVCGCHLMAENERRRHELLGNWAISPLRRACLSYNGKVSQLFELVGQLGQDNILAVDYDRLVSAKERVLPIIYDFIELPYRPTYCDGIHPASIRKAARLGERQKEAIRRACLPIYSEASRFVREL